MEKKKPNTWRLAYPNGNLSITNYNPIKEQKKLIIKMINKLGRTWMIAQQTDDGDFEHVRAKDHPFFKEVKRTLKSA